MPSIPCSYQIQLVGPFYLSANMLQQLVRTRLLHGPLEGGDDRIPSLVQRRAQRGNEERLDGCPPALDGQDVDVLQTCLAVRALHEAHGVPVAPARALCPPPQPDARQRRVDGDAATRGTPVVVYAGNGNGLMSAVLQERHGSFGSIRLAGVRLGQLTALLSSFWISSLSCSNTACFGCTLLRL